MAFPTVRHLWPGLLRISAKTLLRKEPFNSLVAALAEVRTDEGTVDRKKTRVKKKGIYHDIAEQVRNFGTPIDLHGINKPPSSKPTQSRSTDNTFSLEVKKKRRTYLDATEADFWYALGWSPGWLLFSFALVVPLAIVFAFILPVLAWFVYFVMLVILIIGLWLLSRMHYIRHGEFFSQKYKIGHLIRFGRIPAADFNSIVAMLTTEALNDIMEKQKSLVLSTTSDLYTMLKPQMTPAVKHRDLLVTTQILAEIREYVKDRPGNVIGISGTRGIGKTYVVGYLARFPSLGTMVPLTLPALPDNVDVARLLLHALADRIAGTSQPSLIRKHLRQGGIWTSIALVALLLFLPSGRTNLDTSSLGDVVSYWRNWLTSIPHLVDLACGAAIIGIGILTWGFLQDPARALARDIRDSLLYEDTHSATATLSASPSVLSTPLTLSGVRGRIRKARGLDTTDVYRAFEKLVGKWSNYSGHQVLLLLDELDRLPSNIFKNVLNQVKPLTRVQGVTTVITISTEATKSFHAQQSLDSATAKDVLDSTFDDVIQISEWTVDDSKRLLAGAMIGIPPGQAKKLHDLAQGRPRQLIRLAWQVCELRQGKKPITIAKLPSDSSVSTENPPSWDEAIKILEEVYTESPFIPPSSPAYM